MQDYWLGFLTCAVLISVYRLLSYLARERTITERLADLERWRDEVVKKTEKK